MHILVVRALMHMQALTLNCKCTCCAQAPDSGFCLSWLLKRPFFHPLDQKIYSSPEIPTTRAAPPSLLFSSIHHQEKRVQVQQAGTAIKAPTVGRSRAVQYVPFEPVFLGYWLSSPDWYFLLHAKIFLHSLSSCGSCRAGIRNHYE